MYRGISRSVTGALLAVAALAGTAGCAVGGGSAAAASRSSLGLKVPAEPEPGIRDLAQGLRADNGYLSRAVSVVTSECMKKNGYSYPVESAATAAHSRKPAELTYGLSVEEASARGYTSLSRILSVPEGDNGGSTSTSGSSSAGTGADRPTRGEALFGDPDGAEVATISDPIVGGTLSMPRSGCLAEARTRIYGSLERALIFETLTGNLASKSGVEAATDADHIRLNSEWSKCMADAGLPNLGSPDFAISQARVLAGNRISGLAVGQPKAIAVQDAKCEASLDYAAKRRHIEDRYLTAMMTRFEAEIAGVQETQREAITNARTALGVPAS